MLTLYNFKDRKQAILTNANYEEELDEYTQVDP